MPVLNEADTLQKVGESLKSAVLMCQDRYHFEIILVDNGSTDGSIQKLESIQQSILKYCRNVSLIEESDKGKGNAVRSGIRISSGTIVVIIDADDEYDLMEISSLLGIYESKQCKLLLGSRHLGTFSARTFIGSPILSRYFNIGHWAFTEYFNKLFRTQLTDPATMWKLMCGETVRQFNLVGNGFELDWEIVAYFARSGVTPYEYPVSYKSRTLKEGKKIHPIRDPIKWLYWIPYFRLRRHYITAKENFS
jgi:glycosyltransferase involved in cell wall biosynthesis